MRIQEGARSFLKQEYTIMCVFIACFSIVIFVLVDYLGSPLNGIHIYASVAFIIGSLTSMLCGFIGMTIAVAANFRTTY